MSWDTEDLLVLQLTVERLTDKPQALRYCVLFIININQFCSALQDTKLPAAWLSSHQQQGVRASGWGIPAAGFVFWIFLLLQKVVDVPGMG